MAVDNQLVDFVAAVAYLDAAEPLPSVASLVLKKIMKSIKNLLLEVGHCNCAQEINACMHACIDSI